MTIADWRMEIDDIDNQLLALLNKRAKLAVRIGKLKTANNQPLTDEARERCLIARLARINAGPFDDAAVSAIFQQIINETRHLEAAAFTRDQKTVSHRKLTSSIFAHSPQKKSQVSK
ncbi:MAG: chorismate mutase [Acidobacteriota bacterium]